jgi:type I restriction enzyme S subunit
MKSQVNKNPEDWKIVKLEDVILDIGDGGTPSTKIKEYFNGTIPWVNIEDIKRDIYDTQRHLSEAGLKNSSAKLWPEGTIIFSFGASIGKVGIARVKLCTKQGIAGIVPNSNKIDSEFLYYILMKESEKIKKIGQSMGSTIREVRPSKLVKLIVFGLPPLSEQKAIAQVLSTVDKAIQKVDEIIVKTERLRKGLMRELLTGRIRVEEKDGKIVFRKETEFKEDTEIGKIPKDWEVVKLGDIANIKRGASPRPKGDPKYFGGDIPWIKISDLSKYKKGIYLLATDDTVTEEGRKRSVYVKDGSLIISNSGTIGEPAIVKTGRGGCIHDGLVLLTPLIKVEKLFLYYFFEHKKGEFQIRAQKGTQGNMNTTLWKMVKLPLPSIKEQQKIAEILLTIDKKLELERKRKEKLERIKKGLMDLLLTGKIRIKNLED